MSMNRDASMNPYEHYVGQLRRLMCEGRELPLGGLTLPTHPPVAADAPGVLIFAPHPDDEVIIGGMALRLRRELGWKVVNVAVTQGSNLARRAGRWEELAQCCRYIGFELMAAVPGGLDRVDLRTRLQHPREWSEKVQIIADILFREAPRVILFPHDDDWNGTHLGTHHLVVDALKQLGPGFSALTLETEFWGAMDTPNLLVESSERDVSDLIAALSFHVGEVRRNPYHLRMPAWLMDNVRRGGELVGGQGAAAPDFLFGTLYRLRRWQGGRFQDVQRTGRFVAATDDLSPLMA
jgi:LmbE family N-acetylglucosaminyl deacetylase